MVRRVSEPFERSVLVSGLWLRDGHGLALFRHYDFRVGALKRGINPRFSDFGFAVCGGRGRHSLHTPDELRAFSLKTGLDGDALARASRLTARVDNNAVGDGFQLYLHSFVITNRENGRLCNKG